MNSTLQPAFSVIVPTYNYARYLQRALDSILAQERSDYEIVVVDDGSTDDTAEVVRRYQDKATRRIEYVFQNNRGLSAARNHGISLASGEYLLFLDADDELLPGALRQFHSALERTPGLDFVVGGREWVSVDGKVKCRPARPLSSSKEDNFRRLLRGKLGKISIGCFIVHRPVFDRIRFPEETRIGEDTVFRGHLLALFHGVSFPEPVVRIWRHTDSLGHNPELAKRDRLKTVDLLFNPALLSPELMAMRDEFLSLTYLSMFVFFYRQREYCQARPLYHQAIRNYPPHILKWKHLRKYLKIFLGSMRMGPAS
jgi:glycosyltransferase involved in cell wall biosynthesis